MNAAVGWFFDWRFGTSKSASCLLYRTLGCYGRPGKAHHNNGPVVHSAHANTSHNAIDRNVIGKSIYEKFGHTNRFEHFLVGHYSCLPQYAEVNGQDCTTVWHPTQEFHTPAKIRFRAASSEFAA